MAMSEAELLYVRGNLKVPVVLVGMMGVGKSSIGQGLASRLGWEFQDSDKIAEDRAGMPVQEIFSLFGEEKFRKVEKSIIIDLLVAGGKRVIATGGGAVMDSETMQAIKNRSLSVWLQADFDYIFERVSKNDNRPLLKTDNPRETLKVLMEKRGVFYEKADLALDTTKNSIDTSAADLIKLIYGFLRGH